MKVICIDSANLAPCSRCESANNNIVENEVYTVTGNTDRSYIIKGKEMCSCGARHAFFMKRFIPLSDIVSPLTVTQFDNSFKISNIQKIINPISN